MTHHSEPAREAVARPVIQPYQTVFLTGVREAVAKNERFYSLSCVTGLLEVIDQLAARLDGRDGATPAPSASGGLEAANKAEAILRQVRKFIAAEDKHARLSEQGRNTSRDDVDFEHSLVVGFTVQDCDEALRIVKRRAAAPATPAPSASGGLEAVREAHQIAGLTCEYDEDCYTLTWSCGRWLTVHSNGTLIAGKSPRQDDIPAVKTNIAALAAPAATSGEPVARRLTILANTLGSNPLVLRNADALASAIEVIRQAAAIIRGERS